MDVWVSIRCDVGRCIDVMRIKGWDVVRILVWSEGGRCLLLGVGKKFICTDGRMMYGHESEKKVLLLCGWE